MKLPNNFRSWLPAAGVAVLLFLAISMLYFAPQFKGEVLPQHDVQQYEGMQREIVENRKATGKSPRRERSRPTRSPPRR